MNNAKVSVLVPIYNNADYVDGCIQSVVSQDLEDIEILLLDDGSTEQKTIDTIDKYAKEDSRIIVDRHENVGCGATLNRGLQLATGKYVAEIDGDDQFLPHALSNLYELTSDGGIDLVKGTYNADVGNEVIPVQMWNEGITNRLLRPKALSMDEMYCYMMSNPAQWVGLYNRSWLLDNGIHWLPTKGALYQDTSFSFIAKAKAELAYVSNIPVYRYNLTNENQSVRQKFTIDRFDAIRHEYAYVQTYLKQHHMNMWEIYARCKYSSMKWMIQNMSDDMTIALAIDRVRNDMRCELIYKPYYNEDDIRFFGELGLI